MGWKGIHMELKWVIKEDMHTLGNKRVGCCLLYNGNKRYDIQQLIDISNLIY